MTFILIRLISTIAVFSTLLCNAAEPVWPGTGTRYYPGIYPTCSVRGAGTLNATRVQSAWNAWFSGREADYKETYNGRDVTHLGLTLLIDPSLFFTPYWQTSETSPFDWKGTCGRIAAAQNPGASVSGQPVYNWAWWDSLLATTFVAQGKGRLMLRIMETYTGSGNNRTPAWMRNDGYAAAGATDTWTYCQMQDKAVVCLFQDVFTAFASKYKGDPRIAAILLDETYPSHWQQQTLCGLFGGLTDPAKSANAGQISVMKAYLDADSGMLCTFVNWFPGQAPVIATWENGFGGATIGASSLPGVQGHYRQDIKFFNGNAGSGAPCSIDTDTSIFINFFLAQYYGIRHLGPVFVGSEANGWGVTSSSFRTGSSNPWNVSPWPAAGGVIPGETDTFPSAHFWTWYCSGSPRAAGTAADSRLGQAGTDPCGVSPADFYCMDVPNWDAGKPGWTAGNLSIAKWLAAFRTFGPLGTKAMFNLPPGYLDQFAGIAASPARTARSLRIIAAQDPFGYGVNIRLEGADIGGLQSCVIYNIRGERVCDLSARMKASAGGVVRWDARQLPCGAYAVSVRTRSGSCGRNFVLIK